MSMSKIVGKSIKLLKYLQVSKRMQFKIVVEMICVNINVYCAHILKSPST